MKLICVDDEPPAVEYTLKQCLYTIYYSILRGVCQRVFSIFSASSQGRFSYRSFPKTYLRYRYSGLSSRTGRYFDRGICLFSYVSAYIDRFHHARQSSYDKDKALCRIRSPVRIVLWSARTGSPLSRSPKNRHSCIPPIGVDHIAVTGIKKVSIAGEGIWIDTKDPSLHFQDLRDSVFPQCFPKRSVVFLRQPVA
jgi:hypothetical protein